MATKKGSARQELADDNEEIDDETDSETAAIEREKAESLEACPLFSGAPRRNQIAKIWIERVIPAEGLLGKLDPAATEEQILERWGGGEFSISGRATSGALLGKRTVVLAGEPRFQSLLAENSWRRSQGLKAKRPEDELAPSGATGETIGMKDFLVLMQEMEQKRTLESQEREEKHRRDREENDARRKADDAEREERRRKIAQEDEERRDRRHREDMDRMAAANQAQIQQTQSFFAEITKMQRNATPSDGGVGVLVQGMKLALDLKGGSDGESESSPLTAFLSRLPETLAQAREVAGAAYSEISGKGHATASQGDDSLTITGPNAAKLKAAAAKLMAEGKDPEQLLGRLADTILAQQRKPMAIAEATPETRAKRKPGRPSKGRK